MNFVQHNISDLKNLSILKDSATLHKSKIISDDQYDSIEARFKTELYNPNLLIKILLFIVGLLGVSALTGLLAFMLQDVLERSIEFLGIIYGGSLIAFAHFVFAKQKKHLRSGLFEAFTYSGLTFLLISIFSITNYDYHSILLVLILVSFILSILYLDYLTTIVFTILLGYYSLYILQLFDGIDFAPFLLLTIYIGVLFLAIKLEKKQELNIYFSQLKLVKTLAYVLIYLSMNYFAVREMSVEIMYRSVPEGEDIPFAFIFYGTTILIPILYIFLSLKQKSKILIRVSLALLAFSVFTFKYYYSSGHPEITLTLSGLILLGVSFYLLNYLKTPKKGFTREALLNEKWANQNIEAIVISQTLGSNQLPEEGFSGNGGEFGGGGASGEF